MKRHHQSQEELLALLKDVPSTWQDTFASSFLEKLEAIHNTPSLNDIRYLLEEDYRSGILFLQLLMEQSKDEFSQTLKAIFFDNKHGGGKTAFNKDPEGYMHTLSKYGIDEALNRLNNRRFTWKDIVKERLKVGRGSAIKGQTRGKFLEDFVEEIVKVVFSSFEIRESFVGANGISSAKADFCIPSTSQPNIVIEVKAYGATGSKQSDVIGDVKSIISEKRSDTYFLLVTDGITWRNRVSDFDKLVGFQNQGDIYRIYTQSMQDELFNDLIQLRNELKI